jgi:hypothetical protein
LETDKLHQIITNKNKQLEYYALKEAEHIIEQIADCQNEIEHAQEKIGALRKKLTELEIKQMDSATILGGA